MAWIVAVVAAVALAALAIIMMPRPKQPKPDALKDYDNPTAEAGRPFPVPFGTITIKGLNNLWFGDKQVRTYKTKA